MSFYNLLFGMNRQTDFLLAVIGLKRHDVQRFRDCHAAPDGATITIYSRTGGNNRGDYPNMVMRKLPAWAGSEDDEGDSTYCTDTFTVPEQWRADVAALGDVMTRGLRPEFGQHLLATLNRTPTPADLEQTAYDREKAALQRTRHDLANGHTFVPHDDHAMRVALELAEENGGELRTCWGILPLRLDVRQNFTPYPNARDPKERGYVNRFAVNYAWEIDAVYWQHCIERFSADHPVTMAKIAEEVAPRLAKQGARP